MQPCESGAQLQKQMLRLLGAKSCPPCGTALLRLLGVEDYPRCGTALLRLLALERSSVYTAWSCQDARQSMARAMRCLQAGGVVKYVPLQPPNLVRCCLRGCWYGWLCECLCECRWGFLWGVLFINLWRCRLTERVKMRVWRFA